MSNMRCDKCKHWGANDNDDDFTHETVPVKRCDKAVQYWDATEWTGPRNEYGWWTVRTEKDPSQMMYVQDGSDYRADFYTKAEFFCAHFEAKD